MPRYLYFQGKSSKKEKKKLFQNTSICFTISVMVILDSHIFENFAVQAKGFMNHARRQKIVLLKGHWLVCYTYVKSRYIQNIDKSKLLNHKYLLKFAFSNPHTNLCCGSCLGPTNQENNISFVLQKHCT